MAGETINHDWLRAVGFKWHELPRSGGKHWVLWFGALHSTFLSSFEDVGIEVAARNDGEWHCWLRSDFARKYGRFIHIRPIAYKAELVELVSALSGQSWNPRNHYYGRICTEQEVQLLREQADRLDRRIMLESPHAEHEKLESHGGALPDHMEEAEKNGKT